MRARRPLVYRIRPPLSPHYYLLSFLALRFSKQRVQGAVEHLRKFSQKRDVRLVFIILPFADGLERGVQVIRKLLLPNSFFDFETI